MEKNGDHDPTPSPEGNDTTPPVKGNVATGEQGSDTGRGSLGGPGGTDVPKKRTRHTREQQRQIRREAARMRPEERRKYLEEKGLDEHKLKKWDADEKREKQKREKVLHDALKGTRPAPQRPDWRDKARQEDS